MDTPIWQDVVRAFALVLVLEGMWPFAWPSRWRNALLRVAAQEDRMLRVFGLASMICGLIVLQLV
ncbi:MAG TPA: DUF2065 domain-containing protein [Candidatus Binatia bacterium]|nr:DUF2065 domain-containing protein [Candidatus Binatia bacterium]